VTVNSGLLGYKNRYALGTGTLILGDGATVGQDGSVNNTPSADGVADRTVANNLSILGNAVFGLGQATGGNSINYFSGGVDLNNGARTLTLGNSTTFSGVVSNGGLVVDNGTGSGSRYLALSGANTYAGGTTLLNNVYMNVYSDGALGAGSLTFSGTNASLRAANNITLANAIVLSNTATVDFINSATSMTLNGAITGAGGLLKTNSATLTLGGANTYAGTTTVDGGTLAVNGSLSSVGSVVVNANGLLGGSGGVGAITGAGTVGPGNSPGILTATSVNPTAGTDFKFEFTALNPTYSNATASGNDLLHLTAASPFAGGTFASGNIVSIYLNSATITDSLLAGTNTTFSGGFFVDGTYALASALTPASFAYYTTSASLGTGSAVDYNGTSYYLLDSTIAAKTTLFDTAVSSAGFATGTVSGTLLTFNAVPEPSTGSLMAFGLGGLVLTRLLRRKQS
jgi:autotransporter-associated beta strand protein